MRTIVIGDIHGCYDELNELIMELETKGEYNKSVDRLIFLGDYIDRGKDSRLVVKFIRKLQKNNNNVIALMGNHEDMLLDYYNGRNKYWTFNGCNDTINSYRGFFKEFESDVEWMSKLPLYYEDDYFVYVHAGIEADKPLNEQSKQDLLWVREPFIFSLERFNKTVIFGHTPSLLYNESFMPYKTWSNNIGIDTGCVFGGKLTALIINDDEVEKFYQVSSKNSEYIIKGEYDNE